MAYCDKCGAYIPDGETACFSCGYDKAKEQQAAAAAAEAEKIKKENKVRTFGGSASMGGTYYQFSNEELREQLEEQRRKQKENSDKWAAAEAERRRSQRQSAGERKPSSAASQVFDHIEDTVREYEKKATGNPGAFSVLSYLGPLWLIPKLFGAKDEFSRYHSRQGLRLLIFGTIACAITNVLGFALTAYLAVKGIKNVLNGEMKPLPIIGGQQ